MRTGVLSLVLLAFAASSAQAFERTAVATDGTQVRAYEDDRNDPSPVAPRAVLARIGNEPPVQLGSLVDARVQAVAVVPGGAAGVAWTGGPGFGEHVAEVSFREPDGSFGPAQRLGTGQVHQLVMNARGDAAIRIDDTVAFRPAGGTFGDRVSVPGANDVALTAFGDTLVTTQTGVVTRTGDGPPSTPQPVLPNGAGGRIVTDGQGRALAVGIAGERLVTAVRAADGTWSPSASTPDLGYIHFLAAAGDPAGNVVVGVRGPAGTKEGSGGQVSVLTGTLPAPDLSAPVRFDGTGFGLSIGMGTDGSAAIAYGHRQTNEVRVVHRRGLGAFGAPVVAECGFNGGTVLAVLDDGRTLLGNAFLDPSRPRVCSTPARPPAGAISRPPILVGETAMIDLGFLVPPGTIVDRVSTLWSGAGFEVPKRAGDGPLLLRREFLTPGRARVNVTFDRHEAAGCCALTQHAFYDIDVFGRPSLQVPRRQPRRRSAAGVCEFWRALSRPAASER